MKQIVYDMLKNVYKSKICKMKCAFNLIVKLSVELGYVFLSVRL
jgi:hypothetical protein